MLSQWEITKLKDEAKQTMMQKMAIIDYLRANLMYDKDKIRSLNEELSCIRMKYKTLCKVLEIDPEIDSDFEQSR